MSATNRQPLAKVKQDGSVSDRHHDGHGYREMEAVPTARGVAITITHSDGRRFEHVIECAA